LFPELNIILIPISDYVSIMKSLIFNYSKNKKQKPKLWIMNQFESILKQRMTQNINNVNIVRIDYLQILIDALDNDDKLVTQNDNLHLADLTNGIVLTKKLTHNVYIYNH
jgi:hypothetical protein